MSNTAYTHNHDITHVINSAGIGQDWAQALITEAFAAMNGGEYGFEPDFSEMSIHDEDLRKTLNEGFEILANQ